MMMKLMIIDDEVMIRKGIRTSIQWEDYDIEICAEAKNGKEGLQKAIKEKPDIVLVDIRMPVMDGLEFADILKDELPSAKIVIVSGYDDFAYAQRALKIGVSEYLLKPVGAEELIELVVKLKTQIQQETNAMEKDYQFEQLWKENVQLIRNKFINSLLRDEAAIDQSFLKKAAQLQVPLDGPHYQVIAIDIDELALIADVDDVKEREWILISVANIAEEVLEAAYRCFVYPGDAGGLVAFLNMPADHRHQLLPLCEKIQAYVRKYMKLSTTIGIGEELDALGHASLSYQQAIAALREKVYRGKAQIIRYHRENHKESQPIAFIPTEDEKRLLQALTSMDRDRLESELDHVFDTFAQSRTPFQHVQMICVKWLLQGVSQLEQIGVRIPDDQTSLQQPYEEMQKYETLQDLKDWVIAQCRLMISLMEHYKKDRYKDIVAVAMQYVDQHYGEKIRLEDAANSAFVTPNYFSRVFKEETGEHFTLWLNKFRIEKAKAFLDDPSLKIYEVSDRVGYYDYKYFTQMFKKYTGYTPKQYRNRGGTVHD